MPKVTRIQELEKQLKAVKEGKELLVARLKEYKITQKNREKSWRKKSWRDRFW